MFEYYYNSTIYKYYKSQTFRQGERSIQSFVSTWYHIINSQIKQKRQYFYQFIFKFKYERV